MVSREFIQYLERKIRNLEAENQKLKQYELENRTLKNCNETLNKQLKLIKHDIAGISFLLEDL